MNTTERKLRALAKVILNHKQREGKIFRKISDNCDRFHTTENGCRWTAHGETSSCEPKHCPIIVDELFK